MQSAQLLIGIGIAVKVGLEIHFAPGWILWLKAKRKRRSSLQESDDSFTLLWVAVPVCALIIAPARSISAKPVLLPLAMATILSVVFSPVASRLERYVGRLLSAAMVVLVVIGLMRAMGYFLTIELADVADQVSEYSDNIGNKLAALEKNTPPWIQHIKEAVSDVQRRVQSANPLPASSVP